MWRTLGQESTIERFSRSIRDNAVHHAYLFVGPEHVGKRTLATDLACALNCDGPNAPCGQCSTCRRIIEGKYPDVHAITLDTTGAAEDTEVADEERRRTRISTEQIEDLQHAATLPPFEGRWKVLLVDNADRMSAEAGNRILKTLEEPPAHVVWMLLAEDENRLLDTVVSRCQRVEVRPLSAADLERHLVAAHGVPEDRARLLARVSRGRTGWALSVLADESVATARTSRVESMIQLVQMTYTARFDFSREMDVLYRRDSRAVLETLDIWTTWWRDLLLVKTGSPESVVNIDYISDLNEQATRMGLEQIRDYIGKLTEARQDLDLNVVSRLVFDSLIYTIPRIARFPGQDVPLAALPEDTSETE
jgi:DNA polymerase-3 subunit delta'